MAGWRGSAEKNLRRIQFAEAFPRSLDCRESFYRSRRGLGRVTKESCEFTERRLQRPVKQRLLLGFREERQGDGSGGSLL